ncbi:MAG: hypothetical protein WCP97_05045 [bacterium]
MLQLISITEVIKNPKRIAEQVKHGASFTVLSHAKPIFTITPIDNESVTETEQNKPRQLRLQKLFKKLDELSTGEKKLLAPSIEEIDANSY